MHYQSFIIHFLLASYVVPCNAYQINEFTDYIRSLETVIEIHLSSDSRTAHSHPPNPQIA